jgi:penicillin amidase
MGVPVDGFFFHNNVTRLTRPSIVVLGITGTLLAGLIVGLFFFRHLLVKSFPLTGGTVTVAGLGAPVDVYRDGYGIPHIKAANTADLMYAAGYVHAQDRLWQMDLLRRAGEGRLSELFGERTLPLDMMFRMLNLPAVADSMEAHLHAESREALRSYADGVNAFIASHRGSYPAEFDMLDYAPRRWEVRHSLIVTRLIAWELALGWWTDLAYGAISERVSVAKLNELFPGWPDSVRVAVPSGQQPRAAANRTPFSSLLDAAVEYRGEFGIGFPSGGSNAWAVNASRSESGYPVLANDPHLGMPQPSRWYLMHLSAPGLNVSGVTVPGLPVVVIGHNDAVAWGFTNAMLDDVDFYVEKPDSSNPGNVMFRGKPMPMRVRAEVIYLGADDSVEVDFRSTIHGPVVNDVHPVLRGDTGAAPVAMRWTGFDVSDEVYGFLRLNAAADPTAFAEGLSYLTVPGQAVAYGDTSGNIAFWTTGRVPLRGKQHPMLPLPGWTGDAEWTGYLDFNSLPRLFNPPDGVIACANQRLSDDGYRWYLSTLWEPPSRILRIRELLQGAAQFTADDFKRMQQDVVSPYAREMTELLLTVCAPGGSTDSARASALDYLRNWDFRFATGDIATTIFNEFYMKLLGNTYLDEMGDSLFHNFTKFGAIPNRVTSGLMASDSSLWFDDVRTPGRESRNDIIRKSLSDALDALRRRMGNVMKEWRWGNLHTVTFRHPFGARSPLERIFDVGPFPAGGGGTTLNKTEYATTDPYAVTVGASMRQVVDLARPREGYFVLTGGQSGQALNGHYDDQTPLWLNGGYIRVSSD